MSSIETGTRIDNFLKQYGNHLEPCAEVSNDEYSTEFVLPDDNNMGNGTRSIHDDIGKGIVRRETFFVWFMRLLVVIVLFLSTLLVAIATFRFSSNKERNAFEESFGYDAQTVLDSVGTTIHLSLTAMDSLVTTTVSIARFSNQTWPFVTLPDFELRSSKSRVLSKAVVMSQYHLVRSEQRGAWETYTTENHGWLNQSIAVQERDPNFDGPIIYDYYTLDFIFDYNEEPQPDRPMYLPTWQSSPVIPRLAPYNWDLFALEPNTSSVALIEKKLVQLSPSYHLPDPDDPVQVAENDLDVEWFQDFVKPGQDASEPVFDILYPILDNVDEVTIVNPNDSDLVGVLGVSIFWRDLIKDTLAQGSSNGVVVVFDNICNPSFTFVLDGPEVHYQGRGDLHDSVFDEYMVTTNLLDLDSFESAYAGVAVDSYDCPHSFRVYPSRAYQDQFLTKQPLILTISAVMIFLFTSLIFLCYDGVVEYRQKLLENSAATTSMIVSSLFPEEVRERVFQSNTAALQQQQQDATSNTTNNNKWRFLTGKKTGGQDVVGFVEEEEGDGGGVVDQEEKGEHETSSTTLPIADLFPETTIFFADLVGFTEWSASRTPIQVFVLLETIFGEFDKVARKRKVFKVETVGDCYVAVTGLPKPQVKHAIIMVLFARECLRRLDGVLDRLSDRLGEDTKQLGMRVGLHSGPTTAGVLRGDKGRFQLFGDTVNTASRMESYGIRGRIHASQSTAERLVAHGKGHWITPRDGTVQVKGKGLMQTYFVKCGTSSADTSSNVFQDMTEEMGGDGCGDTSSSHHYHHPSHRDDDDDDDHDNEIDATAHHDNDSSSRNHHDNHNNHHLAVHDSGRGGGGARNANENDESSLWSDGDDHPMAWIQKRLAERCYITTGSREVQSLTIGTGTTDDAIITTAHPTLSSLVNDTGHSIRPVNK